MGRLWDWGVCSSYCQGIVNQFKNLIEFILYILEIYRLDFGWLCETILHTQLKAKFLHYNYQCFNLWSKFTKLFILVIKWTIYAMWHCKFQGIAISNGCTGPVKMLKGKSFTIFNHKSCWSSNVIVFSTNTLFQYKGSDCAVGHSKCLQSCFIIVKMPVLYIQTILILFCSNSIG